MGSSSRSAATRAYDSPGGADPLQGTPLAYAEMNVLGKVAPDAT
jgi:hypothetical protein